MSVTPQFRKMRSAMQATYGKKKGESVAYATATKRGVKIDIKRVKKSRRSNKKPKWMWWA